MLDRSVFSRSSDNIIIYSGAPSNHFTADYSRRCQSRSVLVKVEFWSGHGDDGEDPGGLVAVVLVAEAGPVARHVAAPVLLGDGPAAEEVLLGDLEKEKLI